MAGVWALVVPGGWGCECVIEWRHSWDELKGFWAERHRLNPLQPLCTHTPSLSNGCAALFVWTLSSKPGSHTLVAKRNYPPWPNLSHAYHLPIPSLSLTHSQTQTHTYCKKLTIVTAEGTFMIHIMWKFWFVSLRFAQRWDSKMMTKSRYTCT